MAPLQWREGRVQNSAAGVGAALPRERGRRSGVACRQHTHHHASAHNNTHGSTHTTRSITKY